MTRITQSVSECNLGCYNNYLFVKLSKGKSKTASWPIAVFGLETSACDVACEERDSGNDDNLGDLLHPSCHQSVPPHPQPRQLFAAYIREGLGEVRTTNECQPQPYGMAQNDTELTVLDNGEVGYACRPPDPAPPRPYSRCVLASASPYERAYPEAVYLRGLAYLGLREGAEATAEFEKILDHKGANWGSAWQHPYWGQFYPLSYLRLARAYALSGDPAKAKSAYQDFLGLWKDADADIPILKEAKAEYAKLQ